MTFAAFWILFGVDHSSRTLPSQQGIKNSCDIELLGGHFDHDWQIKNQSIL